MNKHMKALLPAVAVGLIAVGPSAFAADNTTTAKPHGLLSGPSSSMVIVGVGEAAIDGIDYEVTTQQGAAGGGGANKAQFGAFTITKPLGELSAKLGALSASGQHVGEIDVALVKNGSAVGSYQLKDVTVTGYETNSTTETIKLTYTQIKAGTVTAAGLQSWGWNVKTNTPVN